MPVMSPSQGFLQVWTPSTSAQSSLYHWQAAVAWWTNAHWAGSRCMTEVDGATSWSDTDTDMLKTARARHTLTCSAKLSSRWVKSPEKSTKAAPTRSDIHVRTQWNPPTNCLQSCCRCHLFVASDCKRCSARVQYQSIRRHATRHEWDPSLALEFSMPSKKHSFWISKPCSDSDSDVIHQRCVGTSTFLHLS